MILGNTEADVAQSRMNSDFNRRELSNKNNFQFHKMSEKLK